MYVDESGVPTLVEVKRSSDTRSRREAVAQMLDYAANARTSFTAERMAGLIDARAQRDGTTGDALLADALDVHDAEGFWRNVDANLASERFRLIFVSDSIPTELRRIIEFLNGQMTQTDVLAIEVQQYVDEAGQHQTVVPRVIGATEAAKRAKRTRRAVELTDQQTLLSSLEERDPAAASAAKGLLDWAGTHPQLNVRWNRAGDIGLLIGQSALLRIWDEGTVEVKVWTLGRIDPAWREEARLEPLLNRLEEIEGVDLRRQRYKWPRTPLAPLADPSKRAQFTRVFEEVVDELLGNPST